jgi:superfamily II RNA helicase
MVVICPTTFNEEDRYAEYFHYFSGFNLSSFQKWAIKSIVDNQHILITAHTGSGKTLPAEFAIQYFVNNGKKVIYTAPIKALSNTKLYDFRNKYPEISFGIITGDISENPEADVLIMTTEILQNTIMNRKLRTTNENIKLDFEIDFENDLAAVIFDEVHYINDLERGNVWEQAILMLPPHVQLIMLSATIDKPDIFANWIEKEKRQQSNEMNSIHKQVYLATTEHRVVPLTHYIWMTCHNNTVKVSKNKEYEHLLKSNINNEVIIKNDKNVFGTKEYENLLKLSKHLRNAHSPYVSRQFALNSLVKHLQNTDSLPAICFVFSRKNTERAANEINFSLFEEGSTTPSTIQEECRKILMSKLTNYREYLELPEYTNLIKLLEKGIGYHHAGILSVFREMIEILFDRKLIKLLFATETLAVGVNFSTTSVIFTGITKFDGNNMRMLAPHEYTQIAGRAGRRGIDEIGKVWLCCNLFELPPLYELQNMLSGKPQTLVSKFKVSYSMCLNIIASEESDILAFANKSMINNDISSEVNNYKKSIADMNNIVTQKEIVYSNIRTNSEIMKEYINYKRKIGTQSNKERKRTARHISQLEDANRYIKDDYDLYLEISEYKTDIKRQELFKSNAESFLNTSIERTINLLTHYDFINEKRNITHLGRIASQFQEIHPLVLSILLYETNYFEDFTPKELVGIFSCFTSIRVEDSIKILIPATSSGLVNKLSIKLDNLMNDYEDLEQQYNIYSGSNYERNFDIQEHSMNWCDADGPVACKEIIANIQNTSNTLFIGDFIKAILKINNIASEVERVAESINQVHLIEKIRKIPTLTLKYVATTQSLYI